MKRKVTLSSALVLCSAFVFTACGGGSGSMQPAVPIGGGSSATTMNGGRAPVSNTTTSERPNFKIIFTVRPDPQVHAMRMAAKANGSTFITVPNWDGSFSFKGVTYPYSMVGTSPWRGSATTVVGGEVQPIDFVFADGTRISASAAAAGFVRSPLFHAANFPTGVGQFADVFQRANFHYPVNRYSPNYHVLMAQPSVLPTITYNVPSASGLVVNANGTKLGLVDINFIGNVVTEVIARRQFDPRTLPMLLVGNAVYYQTTTSNCCIIGFHGDTTLGAYEILTYFIASYVSPGIFGPPGTSLSDIWAPSHELGEWLDDPFVDNATPAWGFPQAPKSCFSNLLEVGDPIEGFGNPVFPVSLNGQTYHPQDLAFFSWLAHQTPSIGEGGRYSYLSPAKLTSIPPPCT